MKPIIKYRGGKSKEIPSFERYMPTEYDTYLEPFFGGGAVFFHLAPQRAIINDVNARLTTFYTEQGLFQYPSEVVHFRFFLKKSLK